jgi:response regulator RpfG family c-di-GMP phosphodiesterase
MAEKELLEKTLRGSIEVLTNILSLVNPTAFGRSSRVSRLVKQIARVLQIQDTWQIEIAAMLSQIGCITVPEETMMKVYNGKSLSAEELGMLQAHPQIGHDFINRIPRLESVAEIIAYQEKHFNGSGAPHNQKRGHEIPLGARILKVALDCDKLAESKLSDSDVFREIKCRGEWYDPAVVEALRQVLEDQQSHYEAMYVMIGDLNEKMILAEDVILRNGFLLIAKGQEVSASLRLRLENFQMRGAIQEPIKIFVPRKKTGTAAIQ